MKWQLSADDVRLRYDPFVCAVKVGFLKTIAGQTKQ